MAVLAARVLEHAAHGLERREAVAAGGRAPRGGGRRGVTAGAQDEKRGKPEQRGERGGSEGGEDAGSMHGFLVDLDSGDAQGERAQALLGEREDGVGDRRGDRRGGRL